jgi:CysZ protein
MFAALCRVFSALSMLSPRRIVALSLALAAVTFALLWLAVAGVLYNSTLFEWRPLDWLADLMGGLAVLALSWLLFPAMAMLIMCFFCERIAGVEALDHPEYGPPRCQPIGETRERCCV